MYLGVMMDYISVKLNISRLIPLLPNIKKCSIILQLDVVINFLYTIKATYKFQSDLCLPSTFNTCLATYK